MPTFAEIAANEELINWSMRVLRVLIIFGAGLPIVYILSRMLDKSVTRRFSSQTGMIAGKALMYAGLMVALISVLRELGFNLTALLGAAGIAGVAIGFASQTSFSNLISGIFLIGEGTFKVGDVLQVDGHSGTVMSIDLLSMKLQTFDNRLVRIPNENLIKNNVVNVTRFPIRRFEVSLSVAYKEDISRVVEILKEVADRNPLCLDEPAPMIQFTGFGDSGLNIFFGVWMLKTDFIAVRGSLLPEIKQRLDAEGIEIPFPHQTLYTGEATMPFPIRIINDNPAGDDGAGEKDANASDHPGD